MFLLSYPVAAINVVSSSVLSKEIQLGKVRNRSNQLKQQLKCLTVDSVWTVKFLWSVGEQDIIVP